jgi:hypothetical protein
MEEVGVPASRARERVDVHLHLPTSTIFKILLTALAVAATLRLWPELIFLSLSVLFAVALEPVVAWLVRRNLSVVREFQAVHLGAGSLDGTGLLGSLRELDEPGLDDRGGNFILGPRYGRQDHQGQDRRGGQPERHPAHY